jgi:hypothetical protein
MHIAVESFSFNPKTFSINLTGREIRLFILPLTLVRGLMFADLILLLSKAALLLCTVNSSVQPQEAIKNTAAVLAAALPSVIPTHEPDFDEHQHPAE